MQNQRAKRAQKNILKFYGKNMVILITLED